MKPSKITDILELAYRAREMNLIFNPNFIGEAGLGKSDIIRQWVKKMDELYKADGGFGFIDLRLAYYEGPDFVGYPYEYTDDANIKRMGHALPHFWPTKGRGLILFEEPNRGNTMVTNCMMQILTDRKVGPNYELPTGWMMAAAMNPATSSYDTNQLDTALMDRFENFHIDYDFNTFVNFIENSKWDEKILRFLKSGNWVYKTPDKIGQDGKYISPRTWSKLNAAERAGAANDQQNHFILCTSTLGKAIGNEYWKTCWDDAPVTAQDLLSNSEKAFAKLKKQSDVKSYAGDKISMTVESIIQHYGGWYEGFKDAKGNEVKENAELINEATMVEVAKIIPSDQALNLIKECGLKVSNGQTVSFLKEFQKRHPECVNILKGNIKINRALGNS